MTFKNILIIHHSAMPQRTNNQFPIINNYHIRKGWGKIAYHWLIENDGTIKQGRKETENGTQCYKKGYPISYNMNNTSFGICLAGDFREDYLTDKQKKSLIDLIGGIEDKYGVCKIYPHQFFYPTICPGKNLADYIKTIQLKKHTSVDNSEEARKERRQVLLDKLNNMIK